MSCCNLIFKNRCSNLYRLFFKLFNNSVKNWLKMLCLFFQLFKKDCRQRDSNLHLNLTKRTIITNSLTLIGVGFDIVVVIYDYVHIAAHRILRFHLRIYTKTKKTPPLIWLVTKIEFLLFYDLFSYLQRLPE